MDLGENEKRLRGQHLVATTLLGFENYVSRFEIPVLVCQSHGRIHGAF